MMMTATRVSSGVVLLGWGLAVLVTIAQLAPEAKAECFPALFNFGDSTSDSGGIHATFPRLTPSEFKPYGDTYPGKPWNKFSDGRLLIDFIGEFGPPHLQFPAISVFSIISRISMLCWIWLDLVSDHEIAL